MKPIKSEKKRPGAVVGNKNAAKKEGEKKTGVGRLTVDLGDLLKERLNKAAKAEKKTKKELLVAILEASLKRRGF